MKRRVAGVMAAVFLLASPGGALAEEGGVCGVQSPGVYVTDEPARELAMWVDSPYCDTRTEDVLLWIENGTEKTFDVRAGFQLERQAGNGWVPAEKKELAKPPVWNVMPLKPGEKISTALSMGGFRQPFPPGTYRIHKTLLPVDKGVTQDLYAFFQVMDPAKEIPMAGTAKVLMRDTLREAVLVPENTYGEAGPFDELMEELRGFQSCGDPGQGAALSPVTVTLLHKGGSRTPVMFYRKAFAAYAKVEGRWYMAPEKELLGRLEDLLASYGQTAISGEELVKKLQIQPSMKGAAFQKHMFSEPFAYAGWRAVLSKDGEQISIFQFPSREAADMQMENVDTYKGEKGYYVGLPDARGDFTVSKTYDWAQPPHYFRRGALVALYNGSNEQVMQSLALQMGTEWE